MRAAAGGIPFVVLAVALLPRCAPDSGADSRDPRPAEGELRVENVRVFDPVRGTFTTPTDILIRGNRIEATGELAPAPTGVERLDGAGRYAVPGLWDCHVHLSFLTLGGDSATSAALEALPRNGITSVRDVGGMLDTIAALSRRVAAGRIAGPRIHYAGPLLTRALDEDLEQINQLIPGTARVVESEADIDTMLDRLVKMGATMTKSIDGWDPALYRYYVEGARRRSLAVVHDPGAPILNAIPIDSALAIGVRSIEHAQGAWNGVLRADLEREVDEFMTSRADYAEGEDLMRRIMAMGVQSIDPDRLAALADRWADSGTWFCPTLHLAENAVAGDPPEAYRLPFEGRLAVTRLVVRELSERGVKLLTGQDGPGDPDGTFEEMEALARAGVSPVEILRGATLYAAQSLDLADEFGTIERGKTADILILDADPLERIENIRSVWRVVYDGRVLPSGGNNE